MLTILAWTGCWTHTRSYASLAELGGADAVAAHIAVDGWIGERRRRRRVRPKKPGRRNERGESALGCFWFG